MSVVHRLQSLQFWVINGWMVENRLVSECYKRTSIFHDLSDYIAETRHPPPPPSVSAQANINNRPVSTFSLYLKENTTRLHDNDQF
jgi:hypothetical protein